MNIATLCRINTLQQSGQPMIQTIDVMSNKSINMLDAMPRQDGTIQSLPIFDPKTGLTFFNYHDTSGFMREGFWRSESGKSLSKVTDAEGYFADPAASFSSDGSYAVLRSVSVLRRTGEFSFELLHIEDYEPNGTISDAGAIRFSDDERRLALSISSRNGGKTIILVDLATRIQ